MMKNLRIFSGHIKQLHCCGITDGLCDSSQTDEPEQPSLCYEVIPTVSFKQKPVR